jgi:hypothetical protein
MADYEPASFYAPWPLFGKKFSSQLGEIRANQDALAPIVKSTGYDLTNVDNLRSSGVMSREWGEEDFHNKFRIRWHKGAEDVEFQCNQGTEAVPNWETYFYIDCNDRQVVSHETFRGLEDVYVGGDFYVKGSAFVAGTGEANTGSSLGGDADVFKTKSSVDLQFRGISAGSNITVTENANDIEIASTASGGGGGFYGVIFKETEANGSIFRDDQLNVDSSFFYLTSDSKGKPILSWLSGSVGEANTLANAGGDQTLVASPAKSGTALQSKGLTEGTLINFSSDASAVTINTTAEINTASSLGGTTLVGTKSSSDLRFKGLTAGSNITLTPSGTEVTIASTATGGGGGFYGVIFKETEAGGAVMRDDQLNVDSTYFYLSGSSDGKPILSLKGGLPTFFSHVQSAAAVEWQVSHTINSSRLIAQAWDDANQLITPDTLDTSDPATAFFYFGEATSGWAQLVGTEGL